MKLGDLVHFIEESDNLGIIVGFFDFETLDVKYKKITLEYVKVFWLSNKLLSSHHPANLIVL